jgi:hypothetical protein
VVDWLWFPLLTSGEVGLALVGLALLLVFAVAATWPIRVPGELTRGERSRLGRTDVLASLFAWLVRVTPLLLAVGGTLLFFPVAVPRDLFLSSRARSTLGDDADEWEAKWEELVETASEEGLDMGVVVDAVCDRLIQEAEPGEPWRPADPILRQRLRETVRSTFAEVEPSIVRAREVGHRIETRLPHWVVETVELAVLKAQSQRTNARRYHLLVADHRTDSGDAWDLLIPYLQADASAAQPPSIEVIRRPEQRTPRLERVLEATESKRTGIVVRCIFSVPPQSMPNQTAEIQLSLQMSDGWTSPPKKVSLIGGRRFTLVHQEVEYAASGPARSPQLVVQITEPPLSRPIPPRQAGTVKIQLRVQNPSLWRETWETLKTDSAFRSWREHHAERGQPIDQIALSDEEGEAVVDSRTDPGSVWIYPAAVLPTSLQRPVVHPGPTRPIRAFRGAATDLPGLFSWEALPLRPQMTVTDFRAGNGSTTATRRPLRPHLSDGRNRRNDVDPSPLVTTHRHPRGEATHLALAPEEQDALNPIGEPIRAAIVWTALLNAIQRCRQPEIAVDTQEIEDDPKLILESRDLQEFRATALSGNLLPLLVGLLLLAGVVTRGVAGSPTQRKVKVSAETRK